MSTKSLPVCMAYLCNSKVTDFQCLVQSKQQISWLNIFVNDPFAVKIFQTLHQLSKVIVGLPYRQFFSRRTVQHILKKMFNKSSAFSKNNSTFAGVQGVRSKSKNSKWRVQNGGRIILKNASTCCIYRI